MLSFRRWLLAFAIILLSQLPSEAAIVYTETSRGGTSGELSADNLAPTVLGAFTIGVNTVTGRVTPVSSGEVDIFTFQIPAGNALQTIVLNTYSSQPPSTSMFLALDNGPTFEFSISQINDNTNFPDLSLILGAVVVGNNHVGTDILDDLANPIVNNNMIAFARPLGPGAYSIYIQENMTFSDYSLNFNVVNAVPEPSSVWLVAAITFAALLIAKFRNPHRAKVLSEC